MELTPGAYTLDTLAAAYAEAGKFGDAVAIQTTLVALETKQGKTKDLAEYREHLKSYRAKKPWRDKYAALEGMKKTVPRVVTVRVPVGRVREGPSPDSRIKFRLKKGRTVSIIERKADWYLIARGTGWAHQSLFFNSD